MRLHHLFKDCTSLYGQTSRTRKHRNPSRRFYLLTIEPLKDRITPSGTSQLFPDLACILHCRELFYIDTQ